VGHLEKRRASSCGGSFYSVPAERGGPTPRGAVCDGLILSTCDQKRTFSGPGTGPAYASHGCFCRWGSMFATAKPTQQFTIRADRVAMDGLATTRSIAWPPGVREFSLTPEARRCALLCRSG